MENIDCYKNEQTNGKIIKFPLSSKNRIDQLNETDTILQVQVPKGLVAKIIFEKIENNPTTTITNISNISNNLVETYNNEDTKASNCDIININSNEGNNVNKEDAFMKRAIMYDVLKKQVKFLMTSVFFIVLSLIGLSVFSITGMYIIHPMLYLIILFMGIGWGLTAIFSIKDNKV